MKAVRIVATATGGRPEIHEVTTPVPGPGQVLVRVYASGLNRGEITIASRYKEGPPMPSGVEFAGEVAGVGAEVRGWKAGDRVMGHGNGGQAEYVLSAALALMPVPASLDWVHAAAFPNVFMTAHDALITNGQMRAGETVLVNAASSGIGMAAIQIARALGAGKIIATTRSPQKAAKLAGFGVHHSIDLSTQDQEAEIAQATGKRGVDVVIDSVGASVFEANLRSMAVLGRLVNIGRMGGSKSAIDLDQLWLKRLKLIGVTFRTRSEAERLDIVQACARDLLGFVESGRIELPVDKVFPMTAIGEAHAYMQTDRHFGKIVLTM